MKGLDLMGNYELVVSQNWLAECYWTLRVLTIFNAVVVTMESL